MSSSHRGHIWRTRWGRSARLACLQSCRDRYGNARGFEIAAADGKFVRAQGSRAGQDVVLFSDGIRRPVYVRYDWGNTPDGNVFNRAGLPAVPFRARLPPG